MLPLPAVLNWPTHSCFFFFNDTATTEIYTLSLHDALPIYARESHLDAELLAHALDQRLQLAELALEPRHVRLQRRDRSEEHTSELQSPDHLVCRLLLEKKKTIEGNDAPIVRGARAAICSPL